MPKKILGLRPIVLVLIALLIFLQYEFWFQSGGFFHMMHVRSEVKKQMAANAVLDQQNQALEKNVAGLQSNDHALEGIARSELGMVKKGEVFYQVVK